MPAVSQSRMGICVDSRRYSEIDQASVLTGLHIFSVSVYTGALVTELVLW